MATSLRNRWWISRPLRQALAEAGSYAEWREVAERIDAASGALDWRNDDASPHYEASLIRDQIARLRGLRELGDVPRLVSFLHEVLYRNLGEVAEPQLYGVSLVGTKHLVEELLAEAVAAIDYLARPEETGFDPVTTLEEFRRARHNFGRSALMLSGGATLGFFHLGVVKTLHLEGLLPDVISGASMGAMIASGICSRTDAELGALFADTRQIATDAIEPLSPAEARRRGALFSPERLEAVIRRNCGDYTFAEAFARSGRALNISLSPTRKRQKPRILNHLTAPDVLIVSAALASSAVPGIFPRASLKARGPGGEVIPYMETEAWIDGTFKGDLPMRRVSRLHNVNHFIVSQVNPHVAPVGRRLRRPGGAPFGFGLAAQTVQVQVAYGLSLARQATSNSRLATPFELAYSLAQQRYSGDIDIYPRVRLGAFARLFSNLDQTQLDALIAEGERATWPRLAMIRDQTCIGRALRRSILSLSASVPAT